MLDAVQRRIGAFEKGPVFIRGFREGRSHAQCGGGDIVRRLPHLLRRAGNAVAQDIPLLLSDVLHENREFVPADPADPVPAAEDVLQHDGQPAQHLVPDVMAVDIVELFEMIHIQDQQRNPLPLRGRDEVLIGVPVVQPGQSVVRGLVGQLAPGLPDLGQHGVVGPGEEGQLRGALLLQHLLPLNQADVPLQRPDHQPDDEGDRQSQHQQEHAYQYPLVPHQMVHLDRAAQLRLLQRFQQMVHAQGDPRLHLAVEILVIRSENLVPRFPEHLLPAQAPVLLPDLDSLQGLGILGQAFLPGGDGQAHGIRLRLPHRLAELHDAFQMLQHPGILDLRGQPLVGVIPAPGDGYFIVVENHPARIGPDAEGPRNIRKLVDALLQFLRQRPVFRVFLRCVLHDSELLTGPVHGIEKKRPDDQIGDHDDQGGPSNGKGTSSFSPFFAHGCFLLPGRGTLPSPFPGMNRSVFRGF